MYFCQKKKGDGTDTQGGVKLMGRLRKRKGRGDN